MINPFEELPVIENPDETQSLLTLGYSDRLNLYKRVSDEGIINDDLNLRFLHTEFNELTINKPEVIRTYNEIQTLRLGGNASNLIARRKENELTPEEKNAMDIYSNIEFRTRRILYTRGILTLLNDRPTEERLRIYTPYFKSLYDELNR